ncbi:MAG: tRNA (adenosine(37)-N6)-threonylcarbamoyltransferase complex transferase subunit TsaD [Dehalococcoidia bacterium]|nr:tRNA (adenosine(37)-N6)-threonylcarbamoyltransferase complex transferase subunit TsaD [Dehalococcoidia bacterium]
MKVLGIETSCDETAAAVVEDGRTILSNVVASQVDLHARYGGVVPEVASRKHLESILPVIDTALNEAGCRLSDIGAVATTMGPGLSGALLVGVNVAKAIVFAYRLPLVAVSHLEAHIYANWLRTEGTDAYEPQFPLLALVVSGGHTELVLMKGHGLYRELGRTRDDAAGEAFDKVARLLGLGFPGGPAIEKAAAGARPAVRLPRAWLPGTHDFSFSGLKTAVLRLSKEREGRALPVGEVAAAFQEAVVDVLVTKTVRAAREERAREIILAGGVAANKALRNALTDASPVPVRMPPLFLCTDNAAMVAAGGYYRLQRGETAGLDLDVMAGLGLTPSSTPLPAP